MQAIDFRNRFSSLASKMPIRDRTTLRAMQGFEKVHLGSPDSHLGAAWSSGENVARGAEVTFIDRQGGKEREVMLV